MPHPRISIVIPVYNEMNVLTELKRRLDIALARIEGGHQIVYVDDGSSDDSIKIIEQQVVEDGSVVLVRLSRNFGMDIAMSAGLDHARGDYVVLMHADLQDPPELIPEMIDRAKAGADVVFGRRIGRDESLLKRSLATAFYKLMERLAHSPYQGQAGDFRLMSRRVVDAVRAMPERRRFLRGMVAWVGHEQVPIEYRRAGRHAGRGASYRDLLRLAFEAFTSFSDVPLALASWFGIATAVISGIAAIVVLILAQVGSLSASIGVWILISVLFLGGVQLIGVGILGRYLGRVHDQVLGRPLYLVSEVLTQEPQERASE